MITLSTIAVYKILTILLSVDCINIHNNEPYAYSKELSLVENSIFHESTSWFQEVPILKWIAIKKTFYVHQYISCTIHHNDAVCNGAIGIIIRRCQPPPGPIRHPCAICDRPVAMNHYALQCDSCDQWVHIKCDVISRKNIKDFRK